MQNVFLNFRQKGVYKMKVLITGGRMRTVVKMDNVRTMTIENEASGHTAVRLARHMAKNGHAVMVVVFEEVDCTDIVDFENVTICRYESYHDFYKIMQDEVQSGKYDAVVQSTAVSDYVPNGEVFVKGDDGKIETIQAQGKISSRYEMVAPCTVPTKKILALIKSEWEFDGVVVGFKLESDISNEKLIKRAKKKIVSGDADIVIANLQKWARDYFFMVTDSTKKPVQHGRRNLYRFLTSEIESRIKD